jgi:uncharacterized membrane protein YfcA
MKNCLTSEATTAVVMHITKTVVYQQYLGINMETVKSSIFIGVAMILGTWVSKKIIERIPRDTFVNFVSLLLLGMGIILVIWG